MPYFEPFAADVAFLHAAEGGDLGRDDALVDADDAVLEGLGDAPDAADVAAVEIGRQAELGVVGHAYDLGSVFRRRAARRVGNYDREPDRNNVLALLRSSSNSVASMGWLRKPCATALRTASPRRRME